MSTPASGCCGAELPVPDWDARLPLHRTRSTASDPAAAGAATRPSGRVRSSQASQSARSSTTICRSWIGATSGPGSVVSSVKRRGLAVGLRRVRFHSVGGRDGNQAGPPPGTRLTSVSRNRPSVAVSHENIVVRRGRGYAQGSNYRTERQMLRAAAFWFGMAIGAGLLLELLSSAALPAGSRQEPYHEPDGGPEAQR